MKKQGRMSGRILGGAYKGRKIVLPGKEVTRSSKARLRKSVFDSLQFEIVDRNFIEMFGGSGSVGLEAVSRGAKKAWFIEADADSYAVLKENCRLIDPSRCDVRMGDAFTILPMILEELAKKGEKAYLYIDPPFSIREGYEAIYKKVIGTVERIDPALIHRVIIEHMTAETMPERIGPFVKTKEKRFGKSSLSHYLPEGELE
ncbi:MAG: 23S rRNA (adenine(2030)-N(6))-methyltransferase RlmJ [Epsilonproteobacteria bacterium]|nr:23S rRNA (adenine(2030)-N(6))-methyltransferase RlmJ [Campylobacterota bacterium]